MHFAASTSFSSAQDDQRLLKSKTTPENEAAGAHVKPDEVKNA